MKKFLIFICTITATLAALSLAACKKEEETTDSGVSSDIVVEIPYVNDFTCDYYAGEGFTGLAGRNTAFGSEEEVLIKINFTLSAEAYAAGKKTLTIKPVLSDGFVGSIVGANTSAVNNAELTASYDADDKISKNCTIELKAKFNYCSGNLQIGYVYDDDEYQTTGSYVLLCSQSFTFTYDAATDGYCIYKDPDNYKWLRDSTEVKMPDTFAGKPLTALGDHIFEYCEVLTKVNIPETITSVGEYAFFDCVSLTSIDLPGNVISIGRGAFGHCDSLTNIALPTGVTNIGEATFFYCGNLANIVLPDGVTNIDKSTFYYCTGLTSITIPAGVENIGESAFYYCSNLANIVLPDSVTSIGKLAFGYCSSLTNVTLPDSVTSIGESAFKSCSALTDISIPDGVTGIGVSAFNKCDSLQYSEYDNARYLGNAKNHYCALIETVSGITSIDINEDTKIIGDEAFVGRGIKNVTIPSGVTSIGKGAFSACESLTEIEIPDSVTVIGEAAFIGCRGLSSINVSEKNGAFASLDGNLYTKDGKTLIQYSVGKPDTEFTIPDGVVTIGYSAFFGSSLKNITFPDSMVTIGKYAFIYCLGLTNISIPDGVTDIGEGAFIYCLGLTNISIPDSVTNIGSQAFYECRSLTEISVGKDNNVYKSIDGNLYTKDGKTLLQYAVAKSEEKFTIPGSVTNIGRNAFYGCHTLTEIEITDNVTNIEEHAFDACDRLTSITLPRSVTVIGKRAFSGCSRLKNLTIPDSITDIGEQAFYYCDNLTNVTYEGTCSEWLKIAENAGKESDNGNVTVKCSDGELKFVFN